MYHRFNENKYPSTNIQMEIFKKHMEIITKKKYNFLNPIDFDRNFHKVKTNKEILITIDDGFLSFYENAWPYLKENKIPFILFISTEAVGKNGYMNWEQIKEIERETFAFIGNHSHSHEYLLEFSFNKFKSDILKSIEIFKNNLGYNPIYFSYPFGEFSLEQTLFIKKYFKYAFGQHSGVIDVNKNPYELPRFPINEKYGDLERFTFNIDLLPLEYKQIIPKDKYVINNNPPNLEIEFFEDQKNLKNINCFSDEGSGWKQTNIKLNNNRLIVNFSDKFEFRRGRINCSLNDTDGWRWFGLQFSVKIN
ncbi:polysaccharide deacetylase family protein [Candidatus Pelagibacter sp.]|nr:polysaccharide deacetylase family protein [Candidatus Pelagibacter sp.]